jgi:hypothetical protein
MEGGPLDGEPMPTLECWFPGFDPSDIKELLDHADHADQEDHADHGERAIVGQLYGPHMWPVVKVHVSNTKTGVCIPVVFVISTAMYGTVLRPDAWASLGLPRSQQAAILTVDQCEVWVGQASDSGPVANVNILGGAFLRDSRARLVIDYKCLSRVALCFE